MSTFSGCGGQSARTVDRYMPGDEKKSCATLLAEISMMDDEIAANTIILKEMESGEQQQIPNENLVTLLQEKLN